MMNSHYKWGTLRFTELGFISQGHTTLICRARIPVWVCLTPKLFAASPCLP